MWQTRKSLASARPGSVHATLCFSTAVPLVGIFSFDLPPIPMPPRFAPRVYGDLHEGLKFCVRRGVSARCTERREVYRSVYCCCVVTLVRVRRLSLSLSLSLSLILFAFPYAPAAVVRVTGPIHHRLTHVNNISLGQPYKRLPPFSPSHHRYLVWSYTYIFIHIHLYIYMYIYCPRICM